MILTADYGQKPDPLKDILSNGLGVLGQAIQNSISLGKGRADLQNSQGVQFFDLLNQEEQTRNRRFEFAVGQSNTDRAYDRGVLTSDRAFGQGVLQDTRDFSYGVTRDIKADERADKDFALRSLTVGNSVALANSRESRDVVDHALGISRSVEEAQDREVARQEVSDATARRLISKEKSTRLFDSSDKGYTPKADVPVADLQTFAISNAESNDPEVRAKVNVARSTIENSIKTSTKEQLAPQVELLSKEIASLKERLTATTDKKVAGTLFKQLELSQELYNKHVERFSELGNIAAQLQTGGAVSGPAKRFQ